MTNLCYAGALAVIFLFVNNDFESLLEISEGLFDLTKLHEDNSKFVVEGGSDHIDILRETCRAFDF